MAKILGAQNNSPMHTPKPVPSLPPKNAEPVRQVAPPPRRAPNSSFGGGGNAPSSGADSWKNKLYMSQLPEGVNESPELMKQVLEALKFPPHLTDVNIRVLKLRKEGVQACWLVGPSDNPQWADQMMAFKPQSSIRDSRIHMGKANPPKRVQLSPGRPQRVESLAAKLSKISLGGASPAPHSPMQHSPSNPFESPPPASGSSEGGERRKRGWEKPEGQTKLTFDVHGGEGMQISSPPAVHREKQANVGMTPAPIRAMRMQSGQGSEPPSQVGRGGTPEPEGGDVDSAARSNPTGEGMAVDHVDFDAVVPPTPAVEKVRDDETKGGENDTPN